jgi:hypothetical protein
MKAKYVCSWIEVSGRTTRSLRALVLALAIALTGAFGLYAADDAAAQRLMAEARAKETQAQQLRAAAAAAQQKAADDQMEAGVQERDARILTAQALKLLGADANKQRAFHLRNEARKLSAEANNMFIGARNSEQRAAQHTRNAEELTKAAAQLKDQPAMAGTLESEAKDQTAKAQSEAQEANQARFGAQSMEDRAKTAFAEAEKLDPDTQHQFTAAKLRVAEPRPVK